MANREEYRTCIAKGLKGKQFNKEERKLEFCILSKLCSGKSKDRDEAKLICSQPKEPKPANAKAKRDGAKSCEKNVVEVTQCVMDYFEVNKLYKQTLNVNSIGAAIANALMECQCPPQK